MPRIRDVSKIGIIYQATLKLVLDTGFTNLKMADVARSAKLATGTLYIYFKSKEDLINELFLNIKQQKMDDLMTLFNPANTYEVSFRKLWFNYTQISLVEPERMIFIETFVRSPYLSRRTKLRSDQMLKPLEDFLRVGIRKRIIKNFPVQLLMAQLMGPVHEMVKLQYDNKVKLTPKLMEASFQMAWNGVKK